MFHVAVYHVSLRFLLAGSLPTKASVSILDSPRFGNVRCRFDVSACDCSGGSFCDLQNSTRGFQVTGVFCQSAIESAQNDHLTVAQSLIDNREAHIERLRTLFEELGHLAAL